MILLRFFSGIGSIFNSDQNDDGCGNGDCPPLPGGLIGSNPRPGSGRINTDRPGIDLPGIIGDLTGGVLNPDPNRPGHKVAPNGVRIRPDTGKGPRVDIPANGEKPPETIHFPPGTALP